MKRAIFLEPTTALVQLPTKQSSSNSKGVRPLLNCERGVSLLEVLVGLILIAVICLCTLNYFAFGLGGMGKQGHRRAALERARERLEQLMAAPTSQLPPIDGKKYWCKAGQPCSEWITLEEGTAAQTVRVADFPAQRMETTASAVDDDPSAGTGESVLDVWEFGVKVRFTSNSADDNDFNRVYLKTLKAL